MFYRGGRMCITVLCFGILIRTYRSEEECLEIKSVIFEGSKKNKIHAMSMKRKLFKFLILTF